MNYKYRRIPVLLVLVIIITIIVQLSWSYSEYQKNSSKFKSEMQQVFNVALDNYFSEVAKQKNITIIVLTDSLTKATNLNLENKIAHVFSKKGSSEKKSNFYRH